MEDPVQQRQQQQPGVKSAARALFEKFSVSMKERVDVAMHAFCANPADKETLKRTKDELQSVTDELDDMMTMIK